MNPEIETRMIRKRLTEALLQVEDWRIDAERITRRSDGLWVTVQRNKRGENISYGIGSTEHGVPQAYFEGTEELDKAYGDLVNGICRAGSTRSRPALSLLGIR